MAIRLTQRKKKGLCVLLAAYIIAALTSGPVSGYRVPTLWGYMSGLLVGIAFPWLLFLAAGLFLYIKESGWNEQALFVLLFCYVTLFNLPHPWIIELMLLTPK